MVKTYNPIFQVTFYYSLSLILEWSILSLLNEEFAYFRTQMSSFCLRLYVREIQSDVIALITRHLKS